MLYFVASAGINLQLNAPNLEELKARPWVHKGYLARGELYANTGRKDEALINLNKSLSMCREMGIEYWPDKAKEILDRL